MKKWTNADVMELNINETANGFFDVDWEGPLDFLFGDKSEQKPATPNDSTDSLS